MKEEDFIGKYSVRMINTMHRVPFFESYTNFADFVDLGSSTKFASSKILSIVTRIRRFRHS